MLFSLGFAALLCRFTPPRPPIEQVARQPGVVALAILSFVLAVNAAIVATGTALELLLADLSPEAVLARAPFLLPDASELFLYQILGAGPSVIVCWCLMVGRDQWEPEPTWIDRTGRTLGVCLIVIEVCWAFEWLSRQT